MPIAADIESTRRDFPINPATYIVIVTRGHKHDEQSLGAVIESPARYIGMIGSRRKVKLIFDDLKAAGKSIDPEVRNDLDVLIAKTKHFVTNTVHQRCWDMAQVQGYKSVYAECRATRHWLDTRVTTIYEGANEVLLLKVGFNELGVPAF